MKLKTICIAIALIAGMATVQAQGNIFEKFENNKQITSVFISKMMLKMAPNMEMGGANIKNINDKMDQMEIYTSNKIEAANLMRTESKNLLKDKRYEIAMNINDGDTKVTFYMYKKSETEFKEIIMVVEESKECTIIRMIGSFSMEDIQQVAGK